MLQVKLFGEHLTTDSRGFLLPRWLELLRAGSVGAAGLKARKPGVVGESVPAEEELDYSKEGQVRRWSPVRELPRRSCGSREHPVPVTLRGCQCPTGMQQG